MDTVVVYAWLVGMCGLLTLIGIIASITQYIENERMRNDPTYIPSRGLFPKRKKTRS